MNVKGSVVLLLFKAPWKSLWSNRPHLPKSSCVSQLFMYPLRFPGESQLALCHVSGFFFILQASQ